MVASRHIRVFVVGYSDSDHAERGELASRLRQELLTLDVDDVRSPDADPVPGAKGTAFEWAELVVTAAGAVGPLVAAIRSWLSRHSGARITVEIDGDRISLGDPTTDERRALLDAWLNRHADE